MKTVRKFLLPFWLLIGISIYKFYALWVFHDALRRLSHVSNPYLQYKTIYLFTIFWPFLLLIEAIVYWNFRFRIKKRLWVHLHIWTIFMAMTIVPLIFFVIRTISERYKSPNDSLYFNQQLYQYQFYTFWSLITIGHIFFIATIVKGLSPKKETIADEPTPGLLDEFAD